MPADEYEGMDQEAMMAEAERIESGEAEGKPSVVYEEFKLEKPTTDLLTEAEIAAMADDGSADDFVDDEAEDGSVEAVETQIATEADTKAPALPPVDTSIDYAAKIAEADTLIEELKAQLDDGEIGDAEYSTRLLELAEQRGELRASAKAADAFLAQVEAVESAKWADAVKGFKATHTHLFGPDHFDKFNADVQAVTADPRFANLPFEQQLAKAAQDYAFRAGNPALANPPKGAPKVAAAPKPAAPAQPAKRQPVPTLAKVANSGVVAADGGRFAAIDARIDARDVQGTEAVLSRMTKEQLEAYGASL